MARPPSRGFNDIYGSEIEVAEPGKHEVLLAPDVQRQVLEHRGEWVAFSSTALIAHGPTFESVSRYADSDEVLIIWVEDDHSTLVL